MNEWMDEWMNEWELKKSSSCSVTTREEGLLVRKIWSKNNA